MARKSIVGKKSGATAFKSNSNVLWLRLTPGVGGGLFNPNCLGPEKSMLEQNGALDGKLGKLFIN